MNNRHIAGLCYLWVMVPPATLSQQETMSQEVTMRIRITTKNKCNLISENVYLEKTVVHYNRKSKEKQGKPSIKTWT